MKTRKNKKNRLSVLIYAVSVILVLGMMTGCSVQESTSTQRQTENPIPSEESTDHSNENIEDVSNQSENENIQFEQMAGRWNIDFIRTDASLWGSGISVGNEMELSTTGELSYYIGIGVGGTGQCKDTNGEITVEIQPYEEHSSEKEILELKYVNDNGEEHIFMNWHDEDVYWKRESNTATDNSLVDHYTLELDNSQTLAEMLSDNGQEDTYFRNGAFMGF